ncbi:cell division protein ZapC [Vibrio panuliri]|uniref:Cell division protein ZapC n=1 Tax=Vibrio panuliri TaxID=1381081 RepID=A0A1Q9HFA9_9VIBR|nr:cell division protein ZapC [Vibrio panuliri]KAB1454417.1 cell division protein ZapC [Vibrio panuliri]OLQ87762.1 cell division protein ZapC [Vibrio panuliri]OLQ88423.1 cell division protein ZapC [Vibrio panuliri]
MLKPSDKWTWYYDDANQHLMLDLGNDMVFKTNLCRKLIVECAVGVNEFTVDDASAFQTYKEQISHLDLSEPRQAELALYCVAAKRFHKPVQPKSWFFDSLSDGSIIPEEGDFVRLANSHGHGSFIVLEVGECASLCASINLDDFSLNGSKSLSFGQAIKVMHDRTQVINHSFLTQPMRLVG